MSALPISRRAFALAELLAIVTVVAAVVAVYLVLSSRSRAMSSLGETNSNLRFLAQGYSQFAADHQDAVATFSWRAGVTDTPYADLRNAATDIEAAANQAVSIIRTRGNLPQMPRISNWIPHIMYSQIVLFDHLGIELPSRSAISPEDKPRMAHALNRSAWGQGGATNFRWPFSSSYELPVAFWNNPDNGASAVYNSSNYSTFLIPGDAGFGGRRLGEITYPANKALLYDRHQRHFGPRQAFFMHDEARVPVAAADGSVAVRRGVLGNRGWQPQSPTSQQYLVVAYNPSQGGVYDWDPRALAAPLQDLFPGRYRFTRRGLFGRDFDGAEVP